METIIAVGVLVIVGSIAVRTICRMIKGKDDYSSGGCGCPACPVDSCPVRDDGAGNEPRNVPPDDETAGQGRQDDR